MGQDNEELRLSLLKDYQVDEELMKLAGPDAIFMHCLPGAARRAKLRTR